MNEIWREIKGFEGLYDISNCGRVRSRERMVYQENRKPYLKPEKITYGNVVNGRLMFLLVRDSKERKNCFVHRLVAQAFPEICGEWFEGCEVHHIDGNRYHNNADNLQVIDREDHIQYHTDNTKRIKVAEFDESYNLLNIYDSVEECRKSIGTDKKTMAKYLKGRRGFSNKIYIKLET